MKIVYTKFYGLFKRPNAVPIQYLKLQHSDKLNINILRMDINKLAFLKCIQLAISAICFGFHYKSQTYNFDCDTISITAYGGFIIIATGSVIGYLLESPVNRKIDTFFCLLGCALFSVAGALNIMFFEQFTRSEWKHYGLTKGILSIVTAATFLFNCVIIWRETI